LHSASDRAFYDANESTPERTVAPQSRNAFAIEVDDISASYRVHLDTTWRAGMLDLFKRTRNSDRLIPALREVSFDVPKGTVLGVIGRNGAGKSTLLRTIAGILAPDQGRITVRGRISTLLSVGVGFNDKMTGRENIVLGGLAIGLHEDRLDELTESIGDYAELGEYLDFPVRTYSSGMKMRLAFSVATHLDPEVLLIDEALMGGDTRFQMKTNEKMNELCGGGRTIVLVTHSLSSIRAMATSALWLHQGRIVEFGEPDDVVAKYMRYCRLEASNLDWDQM
jgi:ABC-2 type transport system ATP-binding protein/teichoic acid transport system ATP-binding protein